MPGHAVSPQRVGLHHGVKSRGTHWRANRLAHLNITGRAAHLHAPGHRVSLRDQQPPEALQPPAAVLGSLARPAPAWSPQAPALVRSPPGTAHAHLLLTQHEQVLGGDQQLLGLGDPLEHDDAAVFEGLAVGHLNLQPAQQIDVVRPDLDVVRLVDADLLDVGELLQLLRGLLGSGRGALGRRRRSLSSRLPAAGGGDPLAGGASDAVTRARPLHRLPLRGEDRASLCCLNNSAR